MDKEVIIRVVEKETILLRDTYTYKFMQRNILHFCVVFIAFTGLFFSVHSASLTNYPPDSNSVIIPPLVFGLLGGTGCTLLWAVIIGFRSYVPTYEVYVQGRFHSYNRVIIKTTKEADQVAICKAAKELEDELKTLANKEQELEQIAQNCNKVKS